MTDGNIPKPGLNIHQKITVLRSLQGGQLRDQCFIQYFVCIQAKNPVVPGQRSPLIFTSRIALPVKRHDSNLLLGCNALSMISGKRIENQNNVIRNPAKGIQTFPDCSFFVFGNDNCAEGGVHPTIVFRRR